MTSPDESSIGKRVWSGPAAKPLPAGSLTSSVVFGWKLDDSPPSSFWFLRCPYIMLINAASLFAESFLLFAGAFLTLSFVALAGAETQSQESTRKDFEFRSLGRCRDAPRAGRGRMRGL